MNRVDKKWVCVLFKNGKIDSVDYDTLKWTRKESLSRMLFPTNGRPLYSWQQLRSFGWRCIKASISFEEPNIS